MKEKTRTIAWGGLWLAIAILLPQIFHMTGGPGLGRIFLPMHLPVFLAGLILGPFYGLFIGMLAPVLSHILTGMPPSSPPLVLVMFFELSAYGFFSGLLFVKLKRGLFFTIVSSMILGRLVLGLAVAFVTPVFGFSPPVLVYLKGAVLAGVPGIILQLILLPAILKGGNLVERYRTGQKSI